MLVRRQRPGGAACYFIGEESWAKQREIICPSIYDEFELQGD